MNAPVAAGRAAPPGFEAFSLSGSPGRSPIAAVPGARAADSPAEAVALARQRAGLPNRLDPGGPR